MPLVYPLLVIDIESSGLDEKCYPIEIAIARRQTPDDSIELFETLIKPTDTWSSEHPWMMSAQQVHGISKDELAQAPDVHEVVNSLKQWLGKNTKLISDNPFYDHRWLAMLFDAAQAKLMPWVMWPDHLDREAFHQHGSKVAHRAGEDATAILKRLEAEYKKEQNP